MGRELALDTNIPDHAAFPLYAPSFTIDVSANRGMRDENDEGYLQSIEECYEAVVKQLVHIVPPASGVS
jgi:histone deacetylase 8